MLLPTLIMFMYLYLLILLHVMFMSQHRFHHLINKIHLMIHMFVLTNLSILRDVDLHMFQF
jgi:hypothetical protein